ncbi:hypothetical protein [uncultured Porticoccus sp.]|uniref:hypothetical protein n=1 Tax=uncultured Porticoccus sp. TaxID=1256050 RepID=UPI0030D9F647|tara:strand:- start:269 stop:691 length:423 start_codon:yes stop_codon:yes gene_type:complete
MNKQKQFDADMNPDELYLEEIFTDQKIGSIRRLSPVTRNGDADASREVLYMGSTQVMTPMGALPINFELHANSIGEAAEKFGEEAEVAVERTARELEEMRRDQASKIVVPGQGGGGPAGNLGGGMGGGMGGGLGSSGIIT